MTDQDPYTPDPKWDNLYDIGDWVCPGSGLPPTQECVNNQRRSADRWADGAADVLEKEKAAALAKYNQRLAEVPDDWTQAQVARYIQVQALHLNAANAAAQAKYDEYLVGYAALFLSDIEEQCCNV